MIDGGRLPKQSKPLERPNSIPWQRRGSIDIFVVPLANPPTRAENSQIFLRMYFPAFLYDQPHLHAPWSPTRLETLPTRATPGGLHLKPRLR